MFYGVTVTNGVNIRQPLCGVGAVLPVFCVNIFFGDEEEAAAEAPGIQNNGMGPKVIHRGEVNAVVLTAGAFFVNAAADIKELQVQRRRSSRYISCW